MIIISVTVQTYTEVSASDAAKNAFEHRPNMLAESSTSNEQPIASTSHEIVRDILPKEDIQLSFEQLGLSKPAKIFKSNYTGLI